MFTQIQIITTEKNENHMEIIRTLINLYPYMGMVREYTRNDTTRFLFVTKRSNLKLLQHDLFLLRKCGFDVEELAH